MSKDIDEMEKMLNDYLQFAKIQAQEQTIKINLINLFKEIIKNINNENITLIQEKDIFLNGRQSALRRCFENVIQNGLTYGGKVYINLQKSTNRVTINIEDNGPGIPEDHKCV